MKQKEKKIIDITKKAKWFAMEFPRNFYFFNLVANGYANKKKLTTRKVGFFTIELLKLTMFDMRTAH
jgi:hypothetical protein